MRQGWTKEECSRRSLFTTHTPVPAGHDKFDWELVDAVTGDLIGDDERSMATHEGLCSMSHLGIRMAGRVNAVSHLNSKVASKMFPEAEIAPITNGVHHTTWISPPMARLYDDEARWMALRWGIARGGPHAQRHGPREGKGRVKGGSKGAGDDDDGGGIGRQ